MTDRPQELPPKGSRIGNFKEPKAAKKHVSAQKRRAGNSEAHLALIRQLPCCLPCCRHPAPSDPHHLKGSVAKAERAFGRRATDRRTVPLCRGDHDSLPVNADDEQAWFERVGLPSVYELAEALWHAPRDVAAMTRIVWAHWNAEKD